MTYSSGPAGGRTLPQLLSLIIGGVYLLVGIVGFFITGFDNFAGRTNETLLGFELNPLHNVVHLLVGAAGVLLSRTLGGARTYGWLLAVAYGATVLFGLYAVNNEEANVLSINGADNWLHLVSALAGLVIAFMPVRHHVGARA